MDVSIALPLLIALIGLAIGLSIAFGLAILVSTRPRIGNVFLAHNAVVTAEGPGSARLGGTVENTDVYQVMRAAGRF